MEGAESRGIMVKGKRWIIGEREKERRKRWKGVTKSEIDGLGLVWWCCCYWWFRNSKAENYRRCCEFLGDSGYTASRDPVCLLSSQEGQALLTEG